MDIGETTKICPCAFKKLGRDSEDYFCKRTHLKCPTEGINGNDEMYTCAEFKEALGGN